jgi:hypothetical protein
VDVEVGDLAGAAAGGILGDGGDVVDAETSDVARLVGEAVLDVLVVVDCLYGTWPLVRCLSLPRMEPIMRENTYPCRGLSAWGPPMNLRPRCK